MANECKKCNVVHSSLAQRCFSCGATLKSIKVSRANFGLPTLLATTFLSLSLVILNVNSVFGLSPNTDFKKLWDENEN